MAFEVYAKEHMRVPKIHVLFLPGLCSVELDEVLIWIEIAMTLCKVKRMRFIKQLQ